MKSSMVVLKGELNHGLYILDGEAVSRLSTIGAHDIDQTVLWHRRLGHMSEKGMQVLCKHGILNSKKIGSLEICEACTMGKANKLKFALAEHTTNGILEYVHSDLWGSPNVPLSLNGS